MKNKPKKSKYRIKKCEYSESEHTSYLVQRRSIFGFWYNPDFFIFYSRIYYKSFKGAKKNIEERIKPNKCEVVWYS